MPRIGELLVQRGVCDEEAIHEGLENQVIFGGRLGTNLLETGAVTEEALAAALGDKYGVSFLSGELDLDPEAVALLRPELADRFDVVPYVASERRLGLLCIDPTDLGVMDEIAFVTGRNVHPIVVPEARLWILLKEAYRIQRNLRAIAVRFASLRDHKTADPAEVAGPPATGEVRGAGFPVSAKGPPARPPPPAPRTGELPELVAEPPEDLMPEELWLRDGLTDPAARPEAAPPPAPAPATRPAPPPSAAAPPTTPPPAPRPPARPPAALDLPPFTRDLLARLAVEAGRPPGGDAPSPAPPPAQREPPEDGPLSLEGALVAIEAATDRHAIARVLLRHAREHFRRAMVLVVQLRMARGWLATGGGLPEEVHGLDLPLDAPGIVAAAAARGEPMVAPLVHAESDVRLIDRLGGGAPSEAVAVPIATHGRVVNVLYADAGPGGSAGPGAVDELAAVATFASRRYEALLGRI